MGERASGLDAAAEGTPGERWNGERSLAEAAWGITPSPDLVLSGSSTLMSTLLEHGLADEVLLVVYPVLLGQGKRFFAEEPPHAHSSSFSTNAMPSGVILSTYKVAGPLKTKKGSTGT